MGTAWKPANLGESHGGEVVAGPPAARGRMTFSDFSSRQTSKFPSRTSLTSDTILQRLSPSTQHAKLSFLHLAIPLVLTPQRADSTMATRRNGPINPKDQAPVPTDKSMFTRGIDRARPDPRSAGQASPTPRRRKPRPLLAGARPAPGRLHHRAKWYAQTAAAPWWHRANDPPQASAA